MSSSRVGNIQYNQRSPAVKRILREASEMYDSCYEYYAQPLEDNLFEWHFTVRGAEETDFSNGIYHGRIILPNEYPFKPPSIILLTPNGRFEVNKKICLTISGYHPETWQPCWSIRTILMALISFMPTKSDGALGSVEYTAEERKRLALKSKRWRCPLCGPIDGHLKSIKDNNRDNNTNLVGKTENSQTSRHQSDLDFMKNVSFNSENSINLLNDQRNPPPQSTDSNVNNEDSTVDSIPDSENQQQLHSTTPSNSSTLNDVPMLPVTPQSFNSIENLTTSTVNVSSHSISDQLLLALFILFIAFIVRRIVMSMFYTS